MSQTRITKNRMGIESYAQKMNGYPEYKAIKDKSFKKTIEKQILNLIDLEKKLNLIDAYDSLKDSLDKIKNGDTGLHCDLMKQIELYKTFKIENEGKLCLAPYENYSKIINQIELAYKKLVTLQNQEIIEYKTAMDNTQQMLAMHDPMEKAGKELIEIASKLKKIAVLETMQETDKIIQHRITDKKSKKVMYYRDHLLLSKENVHNLLDDKKSKAFDLDEESAKAIILCDLMQIQSYGMHWIELYAKSKNELSKPAQELFKIHENISTILNIDSELVKEARTHHNKITSMRNESIEGFRKKGISEAQLISKFGALKAPLNSNPSELKQSENTAASESKPVLTSKNSRSFI